MTSRAPRRPTARRRHAPSSLTRLLGLVVGGVLVVGFLLVAVFPTRTILNQRSETSQAQTQLAELRASNDALAKRIDELQTDDAVERIAREDYEMIRPGEEAYAVLPRSEDAVVLPDVWPFTGAADQLNR
jgi:cell division protein FtsB